MLGYPTKKRVAQAKESALDATKGAWEKLPPVKRRIEYNKRRTEIHEVFEQATGGDKLFQQFIKQINKDVFIFRLDLYKKEDADDLLRIREVYDTAKRAEQVFKRAFEGDLSEDAVKDLYQEVWNMSESDPVAYETFEEKVKEADQLNKEIQEHEANLKEVNGDIAGARAEFHRSRSEADRLNHRFADFFKMYRLKKTNPTSKKAIERDVDLEQYEGRAEDLAGRIQKAEAARDKIPGLEMQYEDTEREILDSFAKTDDLREDARIRKEQKQKAEEDTEENERMERWYKEEAKRLLQELRNDFNVEVGRATNDSDKDFVQRYPLVRKAFELADKAVLTELWAQGKRIIFGMGRSEADSEGAASQRIKLDMMNSDVVELMQTLYRASGLKERPAGGGQEQTKKIDEAVLPQAEQATYDLEKLYYKEAYKVDLDLSPLSPKEFASGLDRVRRAFQSLEPESVAEFEKRQEEGHPIRFVFENLGHWSQDAQGVHVNILGTTEDLLAIQRYAENLIANRAGNPLPYAIPGMDVERTERAQALLEIDSLRNDNRVAIDGNDLTYAELNAHAADIRTAFGGLSQAVKNEIELRDTEGRRVEIVFEKTGNWNLADDGKYHLNVFKNSADIKTDLEAIAADLIAKRGTELLAELDTLTGNVKLNIDASGLNPAEFNTHAPDLRTAFAGLGVDAKHEFELRNTEGHRVEIVFDKAGDWSLDGDGKYHLNVFKNPAGIKADLEAIAADLITKRQSEQQAEAELRTIRGDVRLDIDASGLNPAEFNAHAPDLRAAFVAMGQVFKDEFNLRQREGRPAQLVLKTTGVVEEMGGRYYLNVTETAIDIQYSLEGIAQDLMDQRIEEEQQATVVEWQRIENDFEIDVQSTTVPAELRSRTREVSAAFAGLSRGAKNEFNLRDQQGRRVEMIFEKTGDWSLDADGKYHINILKNRADIKSQLDNIVVDLSAKRQVEQKAELDNISVDVKLDIDASGLNPAEFNTRAPELRAALVGLGVDAKQEFELRNTEGRRIQIVLKKRGNWSVDMNGYHINVNKNAADMTADLEAAARDLIAKRGAEETERQAINVDEEILQSDEEIALPDNIEDVELFPLIDQIEEKYGVTINLAPSSKVDDLTEKQAIVNLVHGLRDLGFVAAKIVLEGNEIQIDNQWDARKSSRDKVIYHINAKGSPEDIRDFFKGRRLGSAELSEADSSTEPAEDMDLGGDDTVEDDSKQPASPVAAPDAGPKPVESDDGSQELDADAAAGPEAVAEELAERGIVDENAWNRLHSQGPDNPLLNGTVRAELPGTEDQKWNLIEEIARLIDEQKSYKGEPGPDDPLVRVFEFINSSIDGAQQEGHSNEALKRQLRGNIRQINPRFTRKAEELANEKLGRRPESDSVRTRVKDTPKTVGGETDNEAVIAADTSIDEQAAVEDEADKVNADAEASEEITPEKIEAAKAPAETLVASYADKYNIEIDLESVVEVLERENNKAEYWTPEKQLEFYTQVAETLQLVEQNYLSTLSQEDRILLENQLLDSSAGNFGSHGGGIPDGYTVNYGLGPSYAAKEIIEYFKSVIDLKKRFGRT